MYYYTLSSAINPLFRREFFIILYEILSERDAMKEAMALSRL
jgi:hypothetical protein